jgi:PIN domain nuclease of toxin-antitoxin system
LRVRLEESAESLAVSVISCLEVAQLVKKGILSLPVPLPQWYRCALDGSDIACLPLSPELLYASTRLPDIHRDPADRIIIATAQTYDALLVTRDDTIVRYPALRTLWHTRPGK